MYSLLFLFATSLLLSFLLTPLVRNLFRQLGVVDYPDSHRKLHDGPVPRVGGIAIAGSYILAFALLLCTSLKGGLVVERGFPLIWKLVPAAALIFFVGLLDDLIHLKAWHKLVGQIGAASIAYFMGIRVLGVGGTEFTVWWSLPITILWLVACCNAVNLIDGLDGLAAGVSLVASATMLFAAAIQHNVPLALATAPLVGCLLAFLRYNFNPATVFLGDCGSLFIGFLLGCYGVLWSQKAATMLGMTAPLIALAIPLIDIGLAIVRRFLRGQPIFGADRGHIHHRLLARGLTVRRVALILYGVCGIAAVFSLSMVNHHLEIPIILLFGGATWFGIQRLGYIEFDTAGRMLRQGSFRMLLKAQISLTDFETRLRAARSPDDCWHILRSAYRDFGFCQVRMVLAGRDYFEIAADSGTQGDFRIEIPLSEGNYIYLIRDFQSKIKNNTLAALVDVLHEVLQSKIPDFASSDFSSSAQRETEPRLFFTASASD